MAARVSIMQIEIPMGWFCESANRLLTERALASVCENFFGFNELFAGRMPTDTYPVLAGGNDVVIVELKRDNRSAATWGLPNDIQALIAPSKMLPPNLNTWIEEKNSLIRYGIASVGLNSFAPIAECASQPEI